MQSHIQLTTLQAPELSQRLKRFRKFKRSAVPYLWLSPSLILILLFTLYPVYQLFITAFSKIDFAGVSHGFAGMENFANLFTDPSFPHVLSNTGIWTGSIVLISTVFSLGIAILLNQDFTGRRLVRTALIIPWAASLLITASIWQWIFNYNYGILNLILSDLHIIHKYIYWLGTYQSSFPTMIWIGIFVTVPFTTFIFLSGLQTISADSYEAASVDGASTWRKFWSVTLPSLKQPLMVSIVLNTIYVFNSFPIIWTITQGGPANATQTLITYMYSLAFQVNNMGEAAAASVVSFILLLVFAVSYGIVIMRSE